MDTLEPIPDTNSARESSHRHRERDVYGDLP
jgi:hypothetical protein